MCMQSTVYSKPVPLFPAGTIIEVIGNVASGKTTATRKIAQATTFEYIDIDVYAKNPFLPLFVKDPKRWTFTNDLYFSLIRSQQIPVMLKRMTFSPLILDSSLDMGIYVYSKSCYIQGKMTLGEWEFLQKLHKTLLQKEPTVYATIFIDVPINALMDRIARRGRTHEQDYTRKYVTQLQERLDEYKKDMTALKTRKIVATYHQLEKKIEFHGKEDKKISKLFDLL